MKYHKDDTAEISENESIEEFKVGQKVFYARYGFGVIDHISQGGTTPVRVSFKEAARTHLFKAHYFTLDGKEHEDDEYPSLFSAEVAEEKFGIKNDRKPQLTKLVFKKWIMRQPKGATFSCWYHEDYAAVERGYVPALDEHGNQFTEVNWVLE